MPAMLPNVVMVFDFKEYISIVSKSFVIFSFDKDFFKTKDTECASVSLLVNWCML